MTTLRGTKNSFELCMLECKRYSQDKKKIWDPVEPVPGQPTKNPVRITVLGTGGSGTLVTGVPEEEENVPEGFSWRVRKIDLEDIPPPPPRERWTGWRLNPDEKTIEDEEREMNKNMNEKEAKREKKKRKAQRKMLNPKEWKYSKTMRHLRKVFGVESQLSDSESSEPEDVLTGTNEEKWVELQNRRREALKQRYLDSLPNMPCAKRRKLVKKAEEMFGPEMGYVGPVCPPTCKRKLDPALVEKLNTCLELRTKPCLTQQMPLEFNPRGERICRETGSLVCKKRQENRKAAMLEDSNESWGEEDSEEGDEYWFEDFGDTYDSRKTKICRSSGRPKSECSRTDARPTYKSICPNKQKRKKRESSRDSIPKCMRKANEILQNLERPGRSHDVCPSQSRRTEDKRRSDKRRHRKHSTSRQCRSGEEYRRKRRSCKD